MAEEHTLWEAPKKPQENLHKETPKMEETPKEIVPVSHVKIYQSHSVLMIRLIVLAIVVLAILILFGFIFNSLIRLSGETVSGILSSRFFLLLFGFVFYAAIAYGLNLQWKSTYYEIHPDRIIIYSGLGARKRRVMKTESIESVDLYQGFLGEKFNYGTIEIEFASVTPAGATHETLFNIPDPEQHLKTLEKMVIMEKR